MVTLRAQLLERLEHCRRRLAELEGARDVAAVELRAILRELELRTEKAIRGLPREEG